ncbi:uncharacterized protein JCM6883_003161 [Sporobolomyces salmoneus]|uniref:uncharacterized protein n=1 Tax=Sporobolomyces salmoneus TaxID=183962 RepID=UPI0031812F73
MSFPSRSASPALSSRPSSPNFLNQSTSGNRRALAQNTTLNLSALLADLSTLGENPTLFRGSSFGSREREEEVPQQGGGRGRNLEELIEKGPGGLTREEAALISEEWVERMENVLREVEGVLKERQGGGEGGKIGRMNGVEEWVDGVETGLGNA